MEDTASIRINLSTRELEIKGNEEFISKYDNVIEQYLDLMRIPNNNEPILRDNLTTEINTPRGEINSTVEDTEKAKGIATNSVPDSFGEYYHKLPRSAKDVDKILAAGYFIQQSNDKGTFSTRKASKLLVDQGIKLSNASASLKSCLLTKKVFKHQGDYKVSESGIGYLKKLMSSGA